MGTPGNSARRARILFIPSEMMRGVPASNQSTPERTASRAVSRALEMEVKSSEICTMIFIMSLRNCLTFRNSLGTAELSAGLGRTYGIHSLLEIPNLAPALPRKERLESDGIPVASSRFSQKVVARGSRLDDIQLFAGSRFFADRSGAESALCTGAACRADTGREDSR